MGLGFQSSFQESASAAGEHMCRQGHDPVGELVPPASRAESESVTWSMRPDSTRHGMTLESAGAPTAITKEGPICRR